jgi:hypothetical protein
MQLLHTSKFAQLVVKLIIGMQMPNKNFTVLGLIGSS